VHRHELTHVLPFTPDQLFALVGDVRRYPEFVPWISTLSVEGERDEGEGVSVLDAEVSVGFAFLQEHFATRVRRDAVNREILVTLLRGPFKRLSNRWRFEPHPLGSKLYFEIDFEFKSRLLDALLRANFDRAVGKLVACFEARAAQLYGAKSAAAVA
jgi:coenzyme Q-binding protein COQ10